MELLWSLWVYVGYSNLKLQDRAGSLPVASFPRNRRIDVSRLRVQRWSGALNVGASKIT